MGEKKRQVEAALKDLTEATSRWRSQKRHVAERMPQEIWELAIQAIQIGAKLEEVCELSGFREKRIQRKLNSKEWAWDEIAWKVKREDKETPEEDPALVELRRKVSSLRDEGWLGWIRSEIDQYELFHNIEWHTIRKSLEG